MKQLSFTTDCDLSIISWSEEIARFFGKLPDLSVKTKYYHFFPRVLIEGEDALDVAVRGGKALSLKQHRFTCLFAHVDADVFIEPRMSQDGAVETVTVTVAPLSPCSAARQLSQSQKLISIGKIASTLAHGVRNPLNAIKGAVVYLSDKYSHDENLLEFTRIIEQEFSRLEFFISNFLNSSVLDAENGVVDVNDVLKKIDILTSLQMYTRNIQSLYNFGDVPPITISAFHLEQAVLNVINNAIDAMDAGGKLTISTSAENRDGTVSVVIAITDTGRGMAESSAWDMPMEKREGGKGFGLFITYEILRHYGGHLEIDSDKKRGTTIKLLIPAGAHKGVVQ